MKSIYQNMMKGGLLGAAMLLGVTACTDDHFDIRPSEASGANTIWQNIEANAELDSVAMILKRSKVMRTETDRNGKQSYADLLNQYQEMTAWLPKNGTFNAKSYLDELDRADLLRQTDSVAAMELDYEVSNQFARNHLARFNYESNSGEQRVRMMNGKVSTYNAGLGIFNGVNIDATNANVLSSNGMLHVLEAESPFAYNLWEYITVAPELSELYATLNEKTRYTFTESGSTEGAMNDEGQMEYVDSNYVRSNEILEDAGLTHISTEDSLYVAILPTNACYQTARQELAGLLKYASSYNYDWNSTTNDWTNKGNNALRFNTDSLTEENVSRLLMATSFITASSFPETVNTSNKEEFLNTVLKADSLQFPSTSTVLYNKTPGETNPVFDGQGVEDAINASNGYIFTVDNYNYDPYYSFVQRMEFGGYSTASVTGSTSEMGVYTELNSDNLNDTIDLGGYLDDNSYYYFPVSGNNALRIDFALYNVLSAKYKISVIMLPNCVNKDNIRLENGEPVKESPIFNAEIRDDKGTLINRAVSNVPVDQTKVEKLVLWDSFEFPYTYAELPDNYNSFPVLRLSLSYAQQRRGNVKALSIAKVILEPVRE